MTQPTEELPTLTQLAEYIEELVRQIRIGGGDTIVWRLGPDGQPEDECSGYDMLERVATTLRMIDQGKTPPPRSRVDLGRVN